MRTLAITLFVFAVSITSFAITGQTDLDLQGLSFWFAADDPAMIETNEVGEVVGWKNKANPEIKATVAPGLKGPQLVNDAINGLPVLRFTGKEGMVADFPQPDDETGGLSVFAVYGRPKKLSDEMWQRILSSYVPTTKHDTAAPSWFTDIGKSAEVMEPGIRIFFFDEVARQPFNIGFSGVEAGKELLAADLAEIIIYDRKMTTGEEVDVVRMYLQDKYGIKENTDKNWVRMGPLPKTPERISNTLPLSDQQNKGNWKSIAAVWDEFEGSELDAGRWWDHNPEWRGRPPARFLPRNVTISDGKLHLTFRYEPDLPAESMVADAFDSEASVYTNYSAATVCSKSPSLYGYFEIKAKAMASSASSSWWFFGVSTNAAGQKWRNELDVFELGGKAKDHEYRYGMNLHVFDSPDAPDTHWSSHEEWQSPFRFRDGFHVYGVEWSAERIRYYVDGHMVRNVINTHWKTPLIMIFDSEAMFDWLGVPEPEDLPSTYSVEYVRAWTNKKTTGSSPFKLAREPSQPTQITKDLEAYEKRLKPLP